MWNGMMQGKSIEEGHIQQGNKKLNEKRIHPTQKPVNLYRWIVRKYIGPDWNSSRAKLVTEIIASPYDLVEMKGQLSLFEPDFIKDIDCTKDTPVVYGKPEAAVYGTGKFLTSTSFIAFKFLYLR